MENGNLDDRLSRLEYEVAAIKLAHRFGSRRIWIVFGCILLATVTVGIGLLLMIPLLIWTNGAARRELSELRVRFGLDAGEAAGTAGAPGALEPRTAAKAAPVREAKPAKPFDWELWIGRGLFLSLGTIALLLAAGFFITFTSHNPLFTPGLRVSVVILAGMLLLVLGDREITHVPAFGYALLGGGFGLLLISVYGVFLHFPAAPVLLIFALMLAITFAMGLLAVKHNTWALIALGLAGGYLAPAWIGFQAEGNKLMEYAVVVAYLLILTVFAAAMDYLKRWKLPLVLSLIFGYIVLANSYHAVDDNARLIAISALFLVIYLSAIYRYLAASSPLQTEDILVQIANAAFFGLVGIEGASSGQPVIQGLVGMGAAFLYVLTAVVLPVKPGFKKLADMLCGLAVVFAAVSLVFLLERDTETIGIVLVALVTIWLAGRMESKPLRLTGALLALWTVCDLVFTNFWHDSPLHRYGGYYEHLSKEARYLNVPFAVDIAVIAGLFLFLWLWHKAASKDMDPVEQNFYKLGIVLANLALLIVLQWESLRSAATLKSKFVTFSLSTVCYMLQAGALTYLGILRKSQLLRYSGIALSFWTALYVFIAVMLEGDNKARIITLVILGIALIVISFLYHRRALEAKK